MTTEAEVHEVVEHDDTPMSDVTVESITAKLCPWIVMDFPPVVGALACVKAVTRGESYENRPSAVPMTEEREIATLREMPEPYDATHTTDEDVDQEVVPHIVLSTRMVGV
jgi:hypothetical protein